MTSSLSKTPLRKSKRQSRSSSPIRVAPDKAPQDTSSAKGDWSIDRIDRETRRKVLGNQIDELNTVADIEDIRQSVRQQAAKLYNTRAPSGWHANVRTLLKALDDRQDHILQNPVKPTSRTVKAERAESPAAKRPWGRELVDFATNLAPRTAGERQHTVLEHLRQRLGNTQRGERPTARVRRVVGDQVIYVDVTGDNYRAVLAAADANQSWGKVAPGDIVAFKQLTANWAPFDYGVEEFNEKHRDLTTKWKQKVEVKSAEIPESQKITDSMVDTVVSGAVKKLIELVEPEVLDLVGLPKIVIHGAGSEEIGGEPAYYDAKTQAIHFKYTGWYGPRLLHEFGHHIEEQGPLETWLGMASYLDTLSGNRPLNPEFKGQTYGPSYGWDYGTGLPPLPGTPKYAMSYYNDGATELVPLGLEHHLLNQGALKIDWDDPAANDFDPAYMALLMQAVRPNAVRKATANLPALQ